MPVNQKACVIIQNFCVVSFNFLFENVWFNTDYGGNQINA